MFKIFKIVNNSGEMRETGHLSNGRYCFLTLEKSWKKLNKKNLNWNFTYNLAISVGS